MPEDERERVMFIRSRLRSASYASSNKCTPDVAHSQVADLHDYIDTLHLSSRSCFHRLTSRVKELERTLATERSILSKMREQLMQMYHHHSEFKGEIIDVELPGEEVQPNASLRRAARFIGSASCEDDKIPETKLQLVAMLSSERALSDVLERERDEALERLRLATRHGSSSR